MERWAQECEISISNKYKSSTTFTVSLWIITLEANNDGLSCKRRRLLQSNFLHSKILLFSHIFMYASMILREGESGMSWHTSCMLKQSGNLHLVVLGNVAPNKSARGGNRHLSDVRVCDIWNYLVSHPCVFICAWKWASIIHIMCVQISWFVDLQGSLVEVCQQCVVCIWPRILLYKSFHRYFLIWNKFQPQMSHTSPCDPIHISEAPLLEPLDSVHSCHANTTRPHH